MGKENLKVYGLETKGNFILYLRRLIISTHIQIKHHKRYIKELRRLIEQNNFDTDSANNEYKLDLVASGNP